jgi:uncharacterized membrane protein (DUF485 family)
MKPRHEDNSSYPPDVRIAIEALERGERFHQIEGAYQTAYGEYKRRQPQYLAYYAVCIFLSLPFSLPALVACSYYADWVGLARPIASMVSGVIIVVGSMVVSRIWRPKWATGLDRLARAVEKWKAIAYAHAQERRQTRSDAT